MYLYGSYIANVSGCYIVVLASCLLCNVVCCTEIRIVLSEMPRNWQKGQRHSSVHTIYRPVSSRPSSSEFLKENRKWNKTVIWILLRANDFYFILFLFYFEDDVNIFPALPKTMPNTLWALVLKHQIFKNSSNNNTLSRKDCWHGIWKPIHTTQPPALTHRSRICYMQMYHALCFLPFSQTPDKLPNNKLCGTDCLRATFTQRRKSTHI